MYLYGGHLASASLGKGDGVHEESKKKWHRKEGILSKKWCPSHKFFYILFFYNSIFPSWFLIMLWYHYNEQQNNTSKKRPISVSKIFAQKYFNSTTLSMCVVDTCVPKNSLVSKDVIFYLPWYNVIGWNNHICKKSSFLSFYSFLFLVNNTREVLE